MQLPKRFMNIVYWTNTVIAICTYVLSELDFTQTFAWWAMINLALWFTLDNERYSKYLTQED